MCSWISFREFRSMLSCLPALFWVSLILLPPLICWGQFISFQLGYAENTELNLFVFSTCTVIVFLSTLIHQYKPSWVQGCQDTILLRILKFSILASAVLQYLGPQFRVFCQGTYSIHRCMDFKKKKNLQIHLFPKLLSRLTPLHVCAYIYMCVLCEQYLLPKTRCNKTSLLLHNQSVQLFSWNIWLWIFYALLSLCD